MHKGGFKFMNILEFLRSDGSIVVNKKLAHAIGLDAATMYSELVSKYFYFEARNDLTEDGFFFNTVENIEKDTTLTKYQQGKVIKKLIDLDLIIQSNRGLPQRRYFKVIQDEKKLAFLLEGQKKEKNLTFKSEKIEQLKVNKVDSNNTNVNNPKCNNPKDKIYGFNSTTLDQFFSFNDFLKLTFDQDHENDAYRADHIVEAGQCIDYYLQLFEENMGKEHPKLKANQWKHIAESMFDIYNNSIGPDFEGLCTDDVIEIIDQHFNTKYKNCDYNILHFMSSGIRARRAFEVIFY
jgi:hypothetical protein